MKIPESSLNGWKTRWVKEKLLVTSNFSFSHSVFKRLVSQGRQKMSLCGNGLNFLRQSITYVCILIQVPRYRLRDILHTYDSVGVTARRKGRLHRRTYHVQGPNELWHFDTNHKLIRWGFVIAGVIDGFSRLVTV